MKVSIIIPVFNKHDMSHECIQNVMECASVDYEIIVIDNGSDPPFQPPFSGFNDVRVIRNEENKGFPVAVNQGIREATGDVIILLNNDVYVTPGWDARLLWWLTEPEYFDVREIGKRAPERLPDKPPALSIVGPCTNYAAGLQRVQLPTYYSLDELYKEAGYFSEDNNGQTIEVNFIIGFCMAFRKALYDEIGPFDESLWPCSGEEIDFCFEARERGHKIGIALDVYVHHEGSQTFQELEDNGELKYQAICNRNDAHLAKKWGADFWQRQEVESEETAVNQ